MAKKNEGKELMEKLSKKSKNAYEVMDKKETEKAYALSEEYKEFLTQCKTERECVNFIKEKAKKLGFTEFEYGKKYKAGDKIYFDNRKRSICLLVIGKDSIEEGVSIAAAHIDSPRIDIKQCPLYEDGGMAFFKTHYYGGIKKYQWTALPLALHGTVVKKDLECVDICIGEKDEDPVFCITDLLPHLGKDQMSKTMAEAITGEGLNILIGSRPFDDDEVKDKIKLNVLKLLNDAYGIVEEDLLSAELSLVPNAKARDLGFDRSMICAYGHDDRVCAFPILEATFEAAKKIPNKTVFTIFADKEEIGSEGNTGMQSFAFEGVLCDIAEGMNANVRKVFANSKCLSADVNACFDPNYAEVYESRNTAYINKGIVVTKFTGARGKSGTSDASAEYVAEIRKLFDEGEVLWQTGELGKVDQGGGGTVAMYIAKLNIDVIDVGVPVLSMHAPYEVISKADLYMAYKGFVTFYNR